MSVTHILTPYEAQLVSNPKIPDFSLKRAKSASSTAEKRGFLSVKQLQYKEV